MRLISFVAACVMTNAVFCCHPSAAEEWRPVALRGQTSFNAGIKPGGEGCQWPQAICVDPLVGRFILFGTDVGGIFRSLDGGQSFSPCNIGYDAAGNCGFAIDPRNNNRCLAVGTYNGSFWPNGLYLSTNQAASWKQVCALQVNGYRDFREQVAFDPSSYDSRAGYCALAYWSTIGAPGEAASLYKSTDGGASWKAVANSTAVGNGWVKVHPVRGFVYIANSGGLFRSTNGGVSFSKSVSGNVTGLDVVLTRPDWVFACMPKEVLLSTNSGESFQSIVPNGLASADSLYWIHASPANPQRMLAHGWQSDYNWHKYYSSDGGKNWSGEDWRYQFTDSAGSIMPFNQRQPMFAWHPTNELVAWSFGGDWITKTTNGGALFKFSNNGNDGIMAGGKFNFNLKNPNLLFFAAVDYTGALTTNGGVTWTHATGDQYGSGSDGYAASPRLLFFHYADQLQVSRDGGLTFAAVTNWSGGGSYGDPTDSNILFAGALRSVDAAGHWSRMSGCTWVVTHDSMSKSLFGVNGNAIVNSTNKGASWTVIATLPESPQDIAYDPVRNRLYIARGDAGLYFYDFAKALLTKVSGIPPNQFGANRFNTVAVDPVDPAVVYAGGSLNIYSGDTDVVCSTNAGASWRSLIRNERIPFVKSGPDGGRQATVMRVHPLTRDLWVGTSCFGLWRFGKTDITAALRDGGGTNATVRWSGGTPPHVVLSAAALPSSNWTSIATNCDYQLAVPTSQNNRFFRVAGQ